MKRLLAFLLLAAPLFAQGVRVGDNSPLQTTTTVSGIGTLLVPQQGSINFCAAPANAVPCTNKATTYTDSTLGTACATSTQVVLANTSSCVAQSDTTGNWGVWVAPGQYQWTYTVGGNSYGPFSITAVTTAQTAVVASDFTTAANTNLQNITGLAWTMPPSAATNVSFRCELLYSQATGNAAVAFGIQDVTVAPTNIAVAGRIQTNTTAFTAGTLPTLTTTTATSIVSATPAATGTVFRAELAGYIQQPSNASSSAINIMVSTATSGDAVTVKQGSYCRWDFK